MASSIPFTFTPDTRNPGFYFEVDPSKANTSGQVLRTLILAQATDPALPQVARLMRGAVDAAAFAGAGSPLALMVRQIRNRDIFGEIYAVPVAANPAGTASTVVVTLTGPATAAGTLTAYDCGMRVQIMVTAGMTATQMAAALAAAVNLNSDLPVTATAAAGVVTMTAKAVGPLDLDLRFNYGGVLAGEAFPPGVGATAVVTLGTGAPDLTLALASLGDMPFAFVAVSYDDSVTLDAIKNFLSDATGRWNPTRLLYGHGFAGTRGSLGAVTTKLLARNDQHMTVMPFYDSPTPSWLWAADLIGSIANSIRLDPGIPVQRLAMGVLAPPIGSRFDFADRDVLLHDGGSTFEVDDDGTVRVSRAVTTYQKNIAGQPDDAFLDLETPFQLADVIAFFKTDFSSAYARKKVVSDGTRLGAGNANTVTPQIIRTHTLALYRQLERTGRVQDGATFAAGLVVEYVGGGRVNLLMPIMIADQLRIVAGLIQFTK